jgi:dTDP-4-dehydrorhamnose reductase
MRILVIGSTGMLGRTVKKYFLENGYDVSVLNRSDVDLSKCSYNELKHQIDTISPNIVINCAGLIVQRKGTPTEDFLHVNSIIPRWLANICEGLNMKMIHPTTDCIYDGLNGPYTEDVKWDVIDDYGVSKALGEPSNCTVIRSSIIGEEEYNKLSFLEWVRSEKGNTINGYTNHLWNGVTCLEMCEIINEIIGSNGYWWGVRHYYSPTITKSDMVTYVNEVYDLGITVNSMSVGGIVDKTLVSKYVTKPRPNLKTQIENQKHFWVK